MTDTTPIFENPASENHLNSIKRRIIAGRNRAMDADLEWAKGSLEVAVALRDGRDAFPSDVAFSGWLKTNDLDFYSHQDRAALIGLASDLDLARTVLRETDSRSYRLIWAITKDRFTSAGKPASKRAADRRFAAVVRKGKLGEDVIAKIKGTSLNSAREQDELVKLNCSATRSALTPAVAKLVEAAVNGKCVSAVKFTKSGADVDRFIEACPVANDTAETENTEKNVEKIQKFDISGFGAWWRTASLAERTAALSQIPFDEFNKAMPKVWRENIAARVAGHVALKERLAEEKPGEAETGTPTRH